MKPPPHSWLWLGILFAGPLSVFAQPYAITTLVGSAASPGTADGTNHSAQFIAPTGVALNAAGDLFVMDGNALRSVTVLGTNHIVQTLAGTVQVHGFLDGTNTAARLNAPQGVVADATGNLYVADTFNNAIRKVSRLGTNWVVNILAGPVPPTLAYGTADGTNNSARFHKPYGIAIDVANNLYVADTLNHTIRKISPLGADWVVTTLAGSPGVPGNANGTNQAALFNNPTGLAVDAAGNVYVADFGNNMVRKMTPLGTDWAVTTLAGSTTAGSADGPGEAAGFNAPQCLALDSAGNLFVTDSGNYTLRKVTPDGLVSTIAGSPGLPGDADGIGASARFAQPYGIAVSPTGSLFVADYLGYCVRQGDVAPLLQIRQAGQACVVSWPAALTGFVLQTSPTFPAAAWADCTTGVALSGDFLTFTSPVLPGAAFYRLRRTGP